jgi:hypothetical protein
MCESGASFLCIHNSPIVSTQTSHRLFGKYNGGLSCRLLYLLNSLGLDLHSRNPKNYLRYEKTVEGPSASPYRPPPGTPPPAKQSVVSY